MSDWKTLKEVAEELGISNGSGRDTFSTEKIINKKLSLKRQFFIYISHIILG